jgi:hypothetical protein
VSSIPVRREFAVLLASRRECIRVENYRAPA